MKDIKIVAIGDSITYGFPYTPANSWFNCAAERLKLSYVNSGVNGGTTDGMAGRFCRDVLRYEPTHVVIMGGTNDAYSRSDVGSVMDNIRYMSELALENTIVPIIGIPIPCEDLGEERLLGQYRKEMQHYAASSGFDIIDFHAAMVDENGTDIKVGLYYDEVHPSKSGYKVMTEVAVKVLSNIIIDQK